jgi:Tfp pilus assembly protein PilO
MKIGPREQIILAIVAVVVVIVGIGAFLVWPQIQQLGQLDGKIATAQDDVNSAKQLYAVRVESKNRAAETDAKWLRQSNLVPEGPDLPSLIVELQDAAFSSGVQLIAVTPSTPTGSPTYYTIPITMQVIGTWSDTVDYLQRLLKLNRGLRIVQSSSVRTDNTAQATHENSTLPDYALLTNITVEAYMIPAAGSSATTTPAPAP